MNAGQRSIKRIANGPSSRNGIFSSTSASPLTPQLGSLSRDTSICTSCLHRISQNPSSKQFKRHATTAAAAAPAPTPSRPVTTSGPQKSFALMVSPVISRPALLTRALTPFEKSFYLYQKRLNERTALPFTRYFYYRTGTPADPEWKRKMRGRKSAARDIGQYSGYGRDAWNDEVLVGDRTAEWDSQVEALIRDAEGKTISERDEKEGSEEAVGEEGSPALESTKMEVPKPLPRETEADRNGDTRRLDRKLDRVLYLLMKNKGGEWRFPEDRMLAKENLHQTAERVIIQSCGINTNTWIVGNHPIGYHSITYQAGEHNAPVGRTVKLAPNRFVPDSVEVEREEFGQKVFFLKARIMAGQVDLSKNDYGDQDFQWLTKEEIEKLVHRRYWANIRNMLTER